MTSSSDTFPFGIADVVELLGLTVRRRLPSSLYLNCPFCGDQRGRLNVNTDKNVWRCNRCGAAGGMLALYAAEKVQQIARVAGLQSTSLVWNTAYKGIDDWQLALRQEEAKEKAA